jgi:hypothetical protein
MATITKLYDTYADAEIGARSLKDSGIADGDISVVANGTMIDRDHDGTDDRAEGASTGAGVGAAVGGTAGLLAGLGIMAIPGIGPVVAAGYLASTALGAVAGGTAGGIIGALTQAGVSDADANTYAEGVRRGGVLLSARVPDNRQGELEAKLAGFVDVRSRADAYRQSGWTGFNASGSGMTADEIAQERERYGRRTPPPQI